MNNEWNGNGKVVELVANCFVMKKQNSKAQNTAVVTAEQNTRQQLKSSSEPSFITPMVIALYAASAPLRKRSKAWNAHLKMVGVLLFFYTFIAKIGEFSFKFAIFCIFIAKKFAYIKKKV